LDIGFGEDGTVTTAFGPTGNDVARGVAILPDGRIAVGGDSNAGGNFDFAIARDRPGGTLDTTVNGPRTALTPGGRGNGGPGGLAVQADGKIVQVGETSAPDNSTSDFAAVRYNPDGSLDPSFDFDGRVTTSFGASNAADGWNVAVQADGRIVVAGDVRTGSK